MSAFTGSAQKVATHTADQEAIRARMNANSIAWHSADAETQAALHAENQALASLLGGSVSFDGETGYWSGTAANTSAGGSGSSSDKASGGNSDGQSVKVVIPNFTPIGSDAVEDYSSYLQQMYDARRSAALAELQAAYQSNLAELECAGAGVAETYQAARNSAAGAGELAKRNFSEYAAAAGLNSGTGAQAELARNVTVQNNLNDIGAHEADAIADLRLQRSSAETEYNSAIAKAEAQGDYDLASALYQEKVRVQEALIELETQQQKMALEWYQAQAKALQGG